MSQTQIQAINDEAVEFLCEYYFNEKITPKQAEIVRAIAYQKSKRIVACMMTRYGKTYSVAMGVLLYILFNKNKKIGLIAPIRDQTAILRNYIADFSMRSPYFRELIEIDVKGIERLKREVSKIRITFRNGCSLQILSAEGTGNRLMGWGFDLVIVDESCLIGYEVFRQKIFRMLGDNSESMLVEIGNPWNRNNHFIQHWNNPEFLRIKGDYKDALREGRTTQAFIDEQKSLLTGMEFKILYEAEFPEESEDSLLRGDWITAALNKRFEIKKILDEQTTTEPKLFKEKYGDKPVLVTGVDVAEMGMDSTVAISAMEHNGNYEIFDISSWDKKDTNVTSGLVDKIGQKNKIETIGVDATGVGQGVYADLLALNWNVEEIKVGRSPKTEKAKLRFQNLKAEFYWNLRDLFEQGMISIPSHPVLIEQLRSMRYELTSAKKIRIVDPEKSPDFADALMLCVNTGRKRLIFDFI